MAINPPVRDLKQRSTSPERRDRDAPPTIRPSGWAAIIAVLAISYAALAHVDVKGRSTVEISADAFMRLVGFGY